MHSEDMQKTNKITVYLRISGFSCDPSAITEILGIQPDKVWRKGDLLMHTEKFKHKDNGWEIKSVSSDTIYLESHITDILKTALPVRDKFKNLPVGSSVMLTCGVSFSPDSAIPSIFLDTETLRFLGEINADIDVDLYCVED